MVSIKNKCIQLLVALFLVSVPALGFAMESGDDNDKAKALVTFPQRVATKITDGASFALQQVWEHPKVTLLVGTTVCAAVLVRRYIATSKDLQATKTRLEKHRNQECARVVALKDKHDKDTAQQYDQFGKCQQELAQVLTTADKQVGDARVWVFGLLKPTDDLAAFQSTAFHVIRSVMERSATDGKACDAQLASMQQSGTQTSGFQQGTQNQMVILLRSLGSAKADMAALLEQMRQSGQDTAAIEREMEALLAQLEAQNSQLEAAGQQDARVTIYDDQAPGAFKPNSNNGKE